MWAIMKFHFAILQFIAFERVEWNEYIKAELLSSMTFIKKMMEMERITEKKQTYRQTDRPTDKPI